MRKLLKVATAVAVVVSVGTGVSAMEPDVAFKNVQIHKKWNLLGTSFKISDMSVFNKDEILILWRWDAVNQKWLFYTPSQSIEDLVKAYGYNETFSEIPAFQGFWIEATKDTQISLPYPTGGETQPPSENKNHPPTITVPNSTISVEAGKSVTVNVAVSDPDGDQVTVNVSSSDSNVATASYDNGTLTITGVSEGNTTITLTANDGNGGTATAFVSVKVKKAEELVKAEILSSMQFKINGEVGGDIGPADDIDLSKIELWISPNFATTSGDQNQGPTKAVLFTKGNSQGELVEYTENLNSGQVEIIPTYKQSNVKICIKWDDGSESCYSGDIK